MSNFQKALKRFSAVIVAVAVVILVVADGGVPLMTSKQRGRKSRHNRAQT